MGSYERRGAADTGSLPNGMNVNINLPEPALWSCQRKTPAGTLQDSPGGYRNRRTPFDIRRWPPAQAGAGALVL
jgi:hypothetical protein